MPKHGRAERKKRAPSVWFCLVVGILLLTAGLICVCAYGAMPETVENVLGRAAGWIFVIAGAAWLYRPLTGAWDQLKRAARGRDRARRGLCVKCGYNLKGLPHLRCPECGHRNVPYEEFDEYAPLDDNSGECDLEQSGRMLHVWATLLIPLKLVWPATVLFGLPSKWLIVVSTALVAWWQWGGWPTASAVEDANRATIPLPRSGNHGVSAQSVILLQHETEYSA